MKADYYKTLQINRNAKDDDLRKAYRRLAMKWHPDKNPRNKKEAEDKFKEISEAYDVLSDPQKRAIYDQFGEEGLNGQVPPSAGGAGAGGATAGEFREFRFNPRNADEIFSEFFGFSNSFSSGDAGGSRGGFGSGSRFSRSGLFGEDIFGAFGGRGSGGGGAEASVRKSPQAQVERALVCSLEDLYNGTTKKMKISRDAIDESGSLFDSSWFQNHQSDGEGGIQHAMGGELKKTLRIGELMQKCQDSKEAVTSDYVEEGHDENEAAMGFSQVYWASNDEESNVLIKKVQQRLWIVAYWSAQHREEHLPPLSSLAILFEIHSRYLCPIVAAGALALPHSKQSSPIAYSRCCCLLVESSLFYLWLIFSFGLRKRTTVEEILTIDIKPGWKKGTKITFPEKGSFQRNMLPADLVFIIDERRHGVFKREGNDLIFTQKISLLEALTGFTMQLTTLDGRNLTIPISSIVSPNSEEIVHNEGMPIAKEPSKKGNLRIRFQIMFPSRLTPDQKAGIRELLAP
ncbi:DnaJ protein like ANJ1 [Apostasia shenzhenica]|uniref:DnaJ protein like ANJ1 n=1 Tax=Apostasia shenzhenica TaxID=1088818 RepID=A0A2I0BGM2_9ASPA|nr:DnaJ protein like ANJ1 [Apostasia shenzhenica]